MTLSGEPVTHFEIDRRVFAGQSHHVFYRFSSFFVMTESRLSVPESRSLYDLYEVYTSLYENMRLETKIKTVRPGERRYRKFSKITGVTHFVSVRQVNAV